MASKSVSFAIFALFLVSEAFGNPVEKPPVYKPSVGAQINLQQQVPQVTGTQQVSVQPTNQQNGYYGFQQTLTSVNGQPPVIVFTQYGPNSKNQGQYVVVKVPEGQQVVVPEINIPQIQIPQFEIPQIKIPTIEIPQIQVPNIEIPQIQIPNINVPQYKVQTGIQAPSYQQIQISPSQVSQIQVQSRPQRPTYQQSGVAQSGPQGAQVSQVYVQSGNQNQKPKVQASAGLVTSGSIQPQIKYSGKYSNIPVEKEQVKAQIKTNEDKLSDF